MAATSGFADISDMWNETLSEDGKSYLVDGEWRPLKITEHEIKVRFESEPRKFSVKRTHRGPILESDLISETNILLGNIWPNSVANLHLSLGFPGH